MTEVFQSSNDRVNIKEVDDEIRRTTLVHICYTVLLVGMIALVMLVLGMAKLHGTSFTQNNLRLYVCIVLGCVVTLILGNMNYRKSILKIVNDNKGIIYTSKEVAITEKFVFIDGVRPIRRR